MTKEELEVLKVIHENQKLIFILMVMMFIMLLLNTTIGICILGNKLDLIIELQKPLK